MHPPKGGKLEIRSWRIGADWPVCAKFCGRPELFRKVCCWQPEMMQEQAMQVYLCKAGGRREGPYSLEQINSDLAVGKYAAADYWAWHRGLPEWVPLYSLPGILETRAKTASGALPAASNSGLDTDRLNSSAILDQRVEPAAADLGPDKLPSGMSFAGLEHIFLLTSGDGPTGAASASTQMMLQAITGEQIETVRRQAPFDVVGLCNILEALKGDAPIPGAVWRKMASIRPDLLQQAREGSYRICVRSFRIENGDVISLFLFYNKEKI